MTPFSFLFYENDYFFEKQKKSKKIRKKDIFIVDIKIYYDIITAQPNFRLSSYTWTPSSVGRATDS